MEQFSFFTVPANQTPPKAFLEALLKKYPSFMIGVQECGAGQPLVISELVDKPTLEDINEYLANTSSDTRMIGCWNIERDLEADEIQPYPILIEADGKPAMVVFADGTFSSFEKAKSTLPNSYHAVMDYLKPHVELLCGKFEDDFDKIMEYFNTTDGAKELEGDLFGAQRGHIVIVYPGAVEGFKTLNDTELVADWGVATDHCGFGQPIRSSRFAPKGDAKPDEPAKKPSRFAPQDKPVEKPVEPAKEEPKGQWLKPKVIVQGNQNRKDWYWAVAGMDPGSPIPKEIWENALAFGNAVFIPQAQFDKIKSKPIMLKTDVVEKPAGRDHTQSVGTPDTKPTGTHIGTKHIPGGSKVPQPGFSGDTQSKVLELFSKPGFVTKDLATEEVPTSEELAEKLKKFAVKDDLKTQLERLMSLPFEAYIELADHGGTPAITNAAWYFATRCLVAEAQASQYADIIANDHGTKTPASGPRAETMTVPKPSRFAPRAARGN